MKKKGIVYAWHILGHDGRLYYEDGRRPVVGKWMKAGGVNSDRYDHPKLCKFGMHASRRLGHACHFYAPEIGTWICRVAVRGEIEEDYMKLCGRERKIIWRVRSTGRILGAYYDGLDITPMVLSLHRKQLKKRSSRKV